MSKVPLFIPNKIKQELREMGFNEISIKHMKPEEAWEIIEGRLSKTNYIMNKIVELAQQDLDRLNSLPDKKKNEVNQEIKKKNFINKLLNDNLTTN